MMIIYRYYLTERPPGPGAIPRGYDPFSVTSFDWKKSVSIGSGQRIDAYGCVEYTDPIPEPEAMAYEMVRTEREVNTVFCPYCGELPDLSLTHRGYSYIHNCRRINARTGFWPTEEEAAADWNKIERKV